VDGSPSLFSFVLFALLLYITALYLILIIPKHFHVVNVAHFRILVFLNFLLPFLHGLLVLLCIHMYVYFS
jgi:hypothetical protein